MVKSKTMKKIYLFAAAALMLASCAKDIVETPSTTNETDDTEKGYVTLTFTASHPERTSAETVTDEATTKTEIQADGTVTWKKGDRLKLIIDGDEDVITDEAVISGDRKAATFTAKIKEGKTVKYAVYPSDVTAVLSGEDLKVTVPKEQKGTFEDASIEVGTIGEGNTITLKNVCSLLKFKVANEGATKVFIGGNGAPFAGTAKVNTGILGATYTGAADVPDYFPNVEINVNGPGEYYAAILPAKTTGLSMQIYDGSNEVLAENISSNVLDAGRRTIKDLGELRKTKFGSVRFATPDGAGDKSGSSWDDAIPFSSLLNQLKGTQFAWHMIFMAGGDARLTENIITIKAGSTFKIYGGFPNNLKGRELTSRDLNKYETNILGRAGSAEDRRHFQINDKGNQMTFDGIWFKESYQKVATANFDLYGGTSLLIGNATAVYCVNCIFDSNKKIGDGIIRIGTNDGKGVATAKFERCKFSNNSVSRNGLIKLYTGGKVQLTDCDFTNGNTIGGNNICTALKPEDCVTDGSGNQLGGHVLY